MARCGPLRGGDLWIPAGHYPAGVPAGRLLEIGGTAGTSGSWVSWCGGVTVLMLGPPRSLRAGVSGGACGPTGAVQYEHNEGVRVPAPLGGGWLPWLLYGIAVDQEIAPSICGVFPCTAHRFFPR